MDAITITTVLFHAIFDTVGILLNLILLYLVLFRTQSRFGVYAILIGNAAITDFIACFTSLLVQQRVIPIGTSLIYISHGPCCVIGPEFCFITYCVMVATYTHSLYSLLFSFYFRYYVLKYQQPSARAAQSCFCLLLDIIIHQFINGVLANQPESEVVVVLMQELPQYNIVNATISGHTNVFEWKTLIAILLMVLPIMPVAAGVLLLRRRIIAMLAMLTMSENTKSMHKQLLEALTYQALLPSLLVIALISYLCGQLGFYHHPLVESITFFSTSVFPVFSPLMSLYFIVPYRKTVLNVFVRARKRVSQTAEGE
ncbi:7TM chemoreceptor [Cooperia oncophora]